MSQVRSTEVLIATPAPEVWSPILLAMVGTVLPFEHPNFPAVSPGEVLDQILLLFPVEDDPVFATMRRALVLFAECSLFETPPAPFIADERRDLRLSRMPPSDIAAAIGSKVAHDCAMWAVYRDTFGTASLGALSKDARRAYLALWAASELVTRRRFYTGIRALITVSAYSLEPLWAAVGYDGPVLRHG